VVGKLDP